MIRLLSSLFFFFATLVIPPLTTLAAPTTVPAGLNPGEQYRLVFATSTTTTATSSDINYYNNFVTSVADSVPQLGALGTTWTAIASTATVAAKDNTSTNPATSNGYPIYNLGGFLIASNNAALWSGSLASPIFYGETGEVNVVVVFTGSLPNGSIDPQYYLGNTNTPPDAEIGGSLYMDSNWIQLGINHEQLAPAHLYGLSGVLTVPVPEPSTMVLTGFAAAGLGIAAIQRRNRNHKSQSA